MSQPLTRDNTHLSESIRSDPGGRREAPAEPSEAVLGYVRDSISENTKRAYRSDLQHFLEWGGTIPSTDVMLADYLAQHVETLSIATLARRIASISKAHTSQGLPTPTQTELVKSTMRGIRRTHGKPQRRAKPLLKEDLFAVLAAMGDRLKDRRDKALLLIGFAGGFRRSELVDINFTDVECAPQGLIVHVLRSKTDQEGVGRRVGIPHGRTRWCPVAALHEWLENSGIREGPIFRSVDRHGNLLDGRLSGEAVSLAIKDRVARVGLAREDYSGHSLRAGLATSAASAGVSSWKIRQQTGHASDAMLARYIRDGELFLDNAAMRLL